MSAMANALCSDGSVSDLFDNIVRQDSLILVVLLSKINYERTLLSGRTLVQVIGY